MKYLICSIRDHKGSFDPQLFCQNNEQQAGRSFAYFISNPNSVLNKFPHDYDLYQVGIFDDESGEIESILPRFIVNGGSVNEKSES